MSFNDWNYTRIKVLSHTIMSLFNKSLAVHLSYVNTDSHYAMHTLAGFAP